MKKLVAISLLGLFALHHAGYYFIYKALKNQNDLTWQSRIISEDLDEEQLQMASIPITFPYQTDQREFQYVDESIELNGKFYRIIKKRYSQDTLHIVYVNDHLSKKIQKDFEKWARQMNQNDSESNNHETQNLIRLTAQPFLQYEYSFRPLAENPSIQKYIHRNSRSDYQVYLSTTVPPPKYFYS